MEAAEEAATAPPMQSARPVGSNDMRNPLEGNWMGHDYEAIPANSEMSRSGAFRNRTAQDDANEMVERNEEFVMMAPNEIPEAGSTARLGESTLEMNQFDEEYSQPSGPKPYHPDFLDPNTLAEELNRMNLLAMAPQPQLLHFCNTPQMAFGHQLYTILPIGSIAPGIQTTGGIQASAQLTLAGMNDWTGTVNNNGGVAYMMETPTLPPPYVDEFGNFKPEILALFQDQQMRFSELPLEAHRKIQTMPGYQIANMYHVTLIRFLSSTLIESTSSYAVFTQKPETGQNWLMAFAVKKDRVKAVVKFNRLLTAHLKATVVSETAIELESSRLAKSFMGEQYVFILQSAEDAKSFMDTLDYGRNQIWTCHGLQLNWSAKQDLMRSKTGFGAGGGKPKPGRGSRQGPSTSVSTFQTNLKSAMRQSSSRSRPSQRSSRNPLFCDYEIVKSVESRLLESVNSPKKEEISIIAQNIIFSTDLTLFIDDFEPPTSETGLGAFATLNEVTADIPCKEFGAGMLCIVERGEALNEVMFVINNTEIVCHHKIFAWTEILLDNQHESGKIICVWNCLPIFANEEDCLPKLRQLLVKFENDETAQDFHTAFSEAKLKATEMTKRPKQP